MSDPDPVLTVDAFQSTSPEYDYWSAVHALAVDRLAFAINSGILLTVFTGAEGAGKSTVVRKVMSDAQSARLLGICPYGPRIKVDPCRAILEAFGADPGPGEKDLHRRILEQSLEAAKQDIDLPTVIVEDAHNLKDAHLFALFDIARLNDGPENALFKIVLVGLPDLLTRLDQTSAALLGPSFNLDAMADKDTAGYVRHRLTVAGVNDVGFQDEALKAVHDRTQGHPQAINLLCQMLLNEARSLGQTQIKTPMVERCKLPTTKALGLKLDVQAPVATGDGGDLPDLPPPSFKSNRKVQMPDSTVAPAAPPASASVKNPDEDPVAAPDPKPSPAAHPATKRGKRSRPRLAAGLAGVAGLALVAYGVIGPARDTRDSGGATDTAMLAGKMGGEPAPGTERVAGTQEDVAADTTKGSGDEPALPKAVAAAPPPPRLADTSAALAVLDSFGAPPEEVDDWYRLALTVADKNPQAAVVAFALAASSGHARAAYFLGQIYELGEGVPVDHVLARRWYEQAAGQVEAAADRLTTPPPDRAQGAPAAPVPLLSFLVDGQTAVLVWTSGTGADPALYAIEFADHQGRVVTAKEGIESSVLRHPVPAGAALWRVRAQVVDGVSAGAVSDWFPIDLAASDGSSDATKAALNAP
ncbi:hypothetical protein GCM10016455_06890 [Aliiroseovarius zhejiangensis]|uniref:ORC1/DEAH AAA+ ATPase domain-containing protein n=1 Tax=Aliiroseovarius zhejiangensis TaxID=1632025 RepID=A0ABQ3IN57_9RHOB|nr:AAA family ATPase [Aliiroseovarius zhejiangensis]GHE89277.1 hypothetical protein GCM10016455_06890 [Aliiroseovarius zhejiangensis]